MKPASTLRLRFTAAALFIAIAAGCGGGGGGGSTGGGDPLPEVPTPLPEPPGPTPLPQVLEWGTFPQARVVIGQQNFVSGDAPPDGAGLDRLELPDGSVAVSADRTLFVAAEGGIGAFPDYEGRNGPTARFAIGATGARSVSLQGSRLVYVVGNEVRIFDTPPIGESSLPSVTVRGEAGCDANTLNAPRHAIITPLGQLVVADTQNHRVLIWTSIPEDGRGADVVVGQRFKDVCAPNDLFGDGVGDSNPFITTLHTPTSVWSDGVKLVVTDSGNHRVLIYDFPREDRAPAAIVLGQDRFDTGLSNAGQDASSDITLSSPMSVDVRESGQMVVADAGNHRVLVWNTFPTEMSQAANQVIGQSAFGRNAINAGGDDPSANSLRFPSGVRFHERNLIVTDSFNHRVLVFPSAN